MSAPIVVAAALACLLFVYLGAALLFPERFQ